MSDGHYCLLRDLGPVKGGKGMKHHEVIVDFTIRGVTKPETLQLTVSGQGTGSGQIKGTMAFDRRDYGMTTNIWFLRIADRVEVNVTFDAKRVGGPPLVLHQGG